MYASCSTASSFAACSPRLPGRTRGRRLGAGAVRRRATARRLPGDLQITGDGSRDRRRCASGRRGDAARPRSRRDGHAHRGRRQPANRRPDRCRVRAEGRGHRVLHAGLACGTRAQRGSGSRRCAGGSCSSTARLPSAATTSSASCSHGGGAALPSRACSSMRCSPRT